MRKGLPTGVLATFVGGGVLAAALICSGVIDVSATAAPPLADEVLAYASARSLAHHAKSGANPLANDRGALAMGLEHYRAMCIACHGGPGAEPAEFAAGLHPAPPDLGSARIQSLSDGVLYQAIAGGIGSTGMPAFGPTHSTEELWSLVAVVRHLPALVAAEKKTRAEAPVAVGAPTTGAVHTVAIRGFKFDPPTLEVRVGEVVEWKNTDFVAHTATADDHAFDTGRIDPGESKRVTVGQAGVSTYFCRYHGAMRGTVTTR